MGILLPLLDSVPLLGRPNGLDALPLNDGCDCTKPCVAEKKLLSNATSDPGVVMCDRHHDDEADVDWSDLSVSERK